MLYLSPKIVHSNFILACISGWHKGWLWNKIDNQTEEKISYQNLH
jgi:hypothetical protein